MISQKTKTRLAVGTAMLMSLSLGACASHGFSAGGGVGGGGAAALGTTPKDGGDGTAAGGDASGSAGAGTDGGASTGANAGGATTGSGGASGVDPTGARSARGALLDQVKDTVGGGANGTPLATAGNALLIPTTNLVAAGQAPGGSSITGSNQTDGTALSVGTPGSSQGVNASVMTGALTNGALTNGSLTSNSVLASNGSQLATANAGGSTLVGGSGTSLVGVGALSTTQPQGSVVTVGVPNSAGAGGLLTGNSLLGPTSSVSAVAGASPAVGTLGATVNNATSAAIHH